MATSRIGAAPSVNGRLPVGETPAVSAVDAARWKINAEYRLLLRQYVEGQITEAQHEAGALALARREAALIGMS
jgi:hypothetical protein